MRIALGPGDIAMVKQGMEILDELRLVAEHVDEIRTEVSIEIYDVTTEILDKCQKVIQAKMTALDQGMQGAGNLAADIQKHLELTDFINEKLQAFKQKYAELKERAISDFKKKQLTEYEQF